MWEMLEVAGFILGLVVLLVVLELLELPEWIATRLGRRRPCSELERELAELRRRVTDLESRAGP